MYMFALGYDVQSKPNGAVMVEGIEERPVNPGEFVSFKKYYAMMISDLFTMKGRREISLLISTSTVLS
jgi:hypothetical protein